MEIHRSKKLGKNYLSKNKNEFKNNVKKFFNKRFEIIKAIIFNF